MILLKKTKIKEGSETKVFKTAKELSKYLENRVIKRVEAPTHHAAENQIAFSSTDFNGPWTFKYEGPCFWFKKKDMCVTVNPRVILSMTAYPGSNLGEDVYIYTQSGALLVLTLKT